MARYGSKAIRGHGIPEAMEQVLTNQSRIPPRMTFLKPLSARDRDRHGRAVRRGGADHRDRRGAGVADRADAARRRATERKTLLAAGAAAGMAATFGSPVVGGAAGDRAAAVRVPPALAHPRGAGRRRRRRACASRSRAAMPVFAMPDLAAAAGGALACYIADRRDRSASRASVVTTRGLLRSRTRFEHLPIHWMWWPAIGAVAVGRGRLLLARARWASGTTTSRDIISASDLGTLSFVAVLCADEVHLLVDLRWAAARRAGRWRRCSRSAAASGLLLGAAGDRLCPAAGVDVRIAGAGGHGGDLRRGVAGAAGVGGVRVRDDAAAAGAAAAAGRVRRVVPGVVRC